MDIEIVYAYRNNEILPDGDIHTMLYSQYKKHYADCKTVPNTYDKNRKTIDVIVPEGRMKPSGVRGQKFRTIYLMVGDDAQHTFEQGFRAITYQNALKQAKKWYKYVEE